MKFEVGDMVRVRKWQDMVDEFGVDSGGDIGSFVKPMKKLCGKPAIVTEIKDGCYSLRPMRIEDMTLDWGWEFTEDMLSV